MRVESTGGPAVVQTGAHRVERRGRTSGLLAAAVMLLLLVVCGSARAQILFVSNHPYCTSQGCYDSRGLWVMNDDGSDAHPWLSELQVPNGEAGLTNPHISPDGRTVVFDGQWPEYNAIWSIGAYRWQAGAITRLSPAPFRNSDTSTGAVSTLHADDPEIGPDGQVYYELRWTSLGTLGGEHGQIWRQGINDVGGEGANLNVCQNVADQGFGLPADTFIGDPSPNPVTEGLFAYTGCYEITGVLQTRTLLRVVSSADGESTALQDPYGYYLSDPSWSPDGNSIVFVDDSGASLHELYLGSRDPDGTWSARLLYTGVNKLSTPRFVGGDRLIFTESNFLADGNPCSDCGLGIRSIPVSCGDCREANSTIIAQGHNADDQQPAWTSATLPSTALGSGLPRDKYGLTISLAGSGSGTVTGGGITCPPTCAASYARGASVELTATAKSGSSFAGWGGACSGTGTCKLKLDDDRAVTATFNTPGTTPPPTQRPELSALSVSPRKFVLGGRLVKGRCVAATRANHRNRACTRKIALRISYRLNRAARVSFTIKREAPGRLVKGRCVAPTRSNRRNRVCTRLVAVRGVISRTGKQGTNSFTFDGTIGGRKLTPSTYRLIATPALNGRTGPAKSISFQIAR